MLRSLKAFVLAGACFAGGLSAGTATIGAARAAGANPYAGLDTLARVLTTIERSYIDPIAAPALVYGAIGGMVELLDRHSMFLDPDEWRQTQEHTDGRFFGVGVELDLTRPPLLITRVVPDGPASLAGVQAGDRIVRIDGADVDQMDPAQASDLLAGDRGSAVVLDITRDQQRLHLSVVRDTVVEIAVDGLLVSPGLAYVRIDRFHRRVGRELATLLDRLAREGQTPLQGVVLDLRDNPGGLLDEAVEVVDLFVSSGTIVDTRGRDGVRLEHHQATASAHDLDARLVVLIDGNSASAAEIVAGALRDLDRATLVGQTTYGKGTVQQVYEFEDHSALKLTVARYVLPGGTELRSGVGIPPDVVVGNAAPSPAQQLHDQIAALDITDELRASMLAQLQAIPTPPPAAASDFPRYGTFEQRRSTDPQLDAAWRLIQDGD